MSVILLASSQNTQDTPSASARVRDLNDKKNTYFDNLEAKDEGEIKRYVGLNRNRNAHSEMDTREEKMDEPDKIQGELCTKSKRRKHTCCREKSYESVSYPNRGMDLHLL